MTDFAQPPRLTGNSDADFPALVEWLWAFYRQTILQGGLLPTDELADEIAEQLPTLSSLGTLNGTPGGILAFSAPTVLISSVLLTLGAPVVGGGSGAAPTPLAPSAIATRYLANTGALNAAAWDQINLSNGVSNVLPVANGGTNISSYTIGDLLQASAATTLAKLPAVATGSALISGGIGTISSWGKIGLTTHVSGVLPIANGGTNKSTWASGDVAYASSANVLSGLAIGTSNKWLRSDGALPAWSTATLPDTWNAGDLAFASAANTLAALPIGASGKVIQSNGTAPVYSPFTLPASIGGTGTILRSDGTNWAASTTTWPNTATSGGVLYASAANAWATSGALGSTQVVLGGGAGAAPNTTTEFTYLTGLVRTTNSEVSSGFFATNNSTTGQGILAFNNDLGAASFGRILYGGSAHASTSFGVSRANRLVFFSAGASSLGILFGTATAQPIIIGTNNVENWRIANGGNLSNTVASGTAYIHLKAGTATASTGQIKFEASTLVATPEAGLLERVTDDLHFTIGTGTARKKVVLDNGTALTSGRVPYATTNGRLTDSVNLTFGTVLGVGVPIDLAGYTVGTLPTGAQGYIAFVTDALAPTYLTAVVGGGAVVTPVFHDGTNWVAI